MAFISGDTAGNDARVNGEVDLINDGWGEDFLQASVAGNIVLPDDEVSDRAMYPHAIAQFGR